MDLSKILSISGKPGLFKMLAQTKNGLVVESLLDGKRFTAFSHERISTLEEISIYTEDEDMPLKDVLKAIYDKQDGKAAISHKSDGSELKTFFEEAIPEYDKENVYVSDIKKVIGWYNTLVEHELISFTEEKEEKKDEEVEESEKPTSVEENKNSDKKETKKDKK
jgi:hypothetical protein